MLAHGYNSTIAAGTRAGRRRAGYTLLEVVGVLLVIAIIAAIVTEGILEKMKQANRDTEGQNLTNIVNALTRNITRTKTIAAPTNWSQALGGEMSIAGGQIGVNRSGNNRLFLVDPNCTVGTNGAGILPYVQTAAGAANRPANARVMILSSVGGPLPAITLTATTFSNIWSTPPNGIPAGWSWSGSGTDLKIQRSDLGNLFHRVILENLEPSYPAPFAIEASAVTNVPPLSRRELWVIDTTALSLSFYPNYAFYSTNSSPTNVVQVQGREALREDTSYVFEHGRWGRYVYYGRSGSTGSFGDWVEAFLHAPAPSNPKFYATQQAVVDPMYDFMYYMGLWGQLGYPPDANPAQPHIPAFVESNSAQVSLDDVSDNLIN